MRLRQEVQALLRSGLITRQRRLPSALTNMTAGKISNLKIGAPCHLAR